MDSNEYEDFAKKHPEIARRQEQIRDELRRAREQLLASIDRNRGMRASQGASFYAPDITNSCMLGRPPMAPGFHGRWENLRLSDLQMLHEMGIDIG